MIKLNSIENKDTAILIWTALLLEALFLVAMLKSVSLSALFALVVFVVILLLIHPAFGLALAATGSVLGIVIIDSIDIVIPVALLNFYLFIVCGGLLVMLFKENIQLKLRIQQPHIISLLLLLVLVFGLTYSTDPGYGLRKTVFFVFYNLMLIFLGSIYVPDNKYIKNIPALIYLAGLALGIVATIIAYSYPSYLRFWISDNVNPIWLARSLGISVIASFFLFTSLKSRFVKMLIVFSYLLLLIPMLRSWSRAPFAGIFLVLFLFLFLQPGINRIHKIISAGFIAIGGFGILFTTSSQIIARLQTPVIEDASTAFRFISWYVAFTDFISSPLLGTGTGSFFMDYKFDIHFYPHNLILEMASENGIVGLILILLFIIFTFRIAFKKLKQAKSKLEVQLIIVFIAGFAYALWNSMFSGNITNNESMWLFAGLICGLQVNSMNEILSG